MVSSLVTRAPGDLPRRDRKLAPVRLEPALFTEFRSEGSEASQGDGFREVVDELDSLVVGRQPGLYNYLPPIRIIIPNPSVEKMNTSEYSCCHRSV